MNELFPPIEDYVDSVYDCIALGGVVSADTLLQAYPQGLFPWYNPDEPVAWWSPRQRCVMVPTQFAPSKSLKRSGKAAYSITVNTVFEQVIHQCGQLRQQSGTWIGADIVRAYTQLFKLGHAYSIEVWDNTSHATLIGGLYGVCMGNMCFGESMFHTKTDASKLAFAYLMRLCVEQNIPLVDCQVENTHLLSLGATLMPRARFVAHVQAYTRQPSHINWQHLSLSVPTTATLF